MDSKTEQQAPLTQVPSWSCIFILYANQAQDVNIFIAFLLRKIVACFWCKMCIHKMYCEPESWRMKLNPSPSYSICAEEWRCGLRQQQPDKCHLIIHRFFISDELNSTLSIEITSSQHWLFTVLFLAIADNIPQRWSLTNYKFTHKLKFSIM